MPRLLHITFWCVVAMYYYATAILCNKTSLAESWPPQVNYDRGEGVYATLFDTGATQSYRGQNLNESEEMFGSQSRAVQIIPTESELEEARRKEQERLGKIDMIEKAKMEEIARKKQALKEKEDRELEEEERNTHLTIDLRASYSLDKNIATYAGLMAPTNLTQGIQLGTGFSLWFKSGLYLGTSIDAFMYGGSVSSYNFSSSGLTLSEKIGITIPVYKKLQITPYGIIGASAVKMGISGIMPAATEGFGILMSLKTTKHFYIGVFTQATMSQIIGAEAQGDPTGMIGQDVKIDFGIQLGGF